MKNIALTMFTVVAVGLACMCGHAHAEEKTVSALQTDLLNTKYNNYDVESDYENKVNITDSFMPLAGNPLAADYASLTLAEVNAGTSVISGVTGKTIYLTDFRLYSSGTMGGLTNLVIECSGGDDIATIPVGNLDDTVVLGPYFSAAAGDGAITFTQVAVDGCPSGEGIQVSADGTGTTATHVIGVYEHSEQ